MLTTFKVIFIVQIILTTRTHTHKQTNNQQQQKSITTNLIENLLFIM